MVSLDAGQKGVTPEEGEVPEAVGGNHVIDFHTTPNKVNKAAQCQYCCTGNPSSVAQHSRRKLAQSMHRLKRSQYTSTEEGNTLVGGGVSLHCIG